MNIALAIISAVVLVSCVVFMAFKPNSPYIPEVKEVEHVAEEVLIDDFESLPLKD